jgi:polyhydroxyalkanoate synthesis repressor PhaR
LSDARIIKKYPNRRLYDTEISCYITLGDVRKLVLDHTVFQVIDAKTKEDITRSILLQIIFEQEEDGEPMFSTQSLEQIVRFYGDDLQSMMSSYIEKSLRLFVEQQGGIRQQMSSVMRGDPLTLMRDITEQNMTLWRDMQENFLNVTSGAQRHAGKDKE